MTELFVKVFNMSVAAGWLVLAVVLLRQLLKKAPKWVNVLLWGVVAVRLACPVSIESVLSLIPSAQTVSPEIMLEQEPQIHTGIALVNSLVNPIVSQSFAPKPHASANPLQIWLPVLTVVWLTGILVLVLYTVFSYARLRRKIGTAVRLRDNIYQSEQVASPFVLGLIRPRIYLPFQIKEQNLEHVLAHEQAHIRRCDHWWKPAGFLLLTLHWFNPLMWIAYVLLCRDIELACDEKVIREMEQEQRADYSQALLACSVNRRMLAVCPLAFGEVGVKTRVKSVLNYKKPAFWLIVLAIVACLVTAVCFLTNPPATEGEESHQEKDEGIQTNPPATEEEERYQEKDEDTQTNLPAEDEGKKQEENKSSELLPGTIYQSYQCLYMSAFSSFLPVDGDSGLLYVVGEDYFSIERRKNKTYSVSSTLDQDSAPAELIEVSEWRWQEFPYTDEEWSDLFQFVPEKPESIHEKYDELLYQPLNHKYFLLRMDGEIWLVKLGTALKVWSIYSLIPEELTGQAAWEFRPAYSSGIPAFCFEFDMEYTGLWAYCRDGELSFDMGKTSSYQVTTTETGQALYWLPMTEDGTICLNADIQFVIGQENGTAYCGRLYIYGGSPVIGTVNYTATIAGTGLRLKQNEEQQGGIIELFE